jgi:hypothetical protein
MLCSVIPKGANMATIQKRISKDGATSYRVQVRLKGFPPESASFERVTDAKAWAQKIEADMKAGRHFGISKRHTFNDLAKEFETQAKDKPRLDYWRGIFGNDTLDTITPARISKQRDKLLNEDTMRYCSPATGNAEQGRQASKSQALRSYRKSLSSEFIDLPSLWRQNAPMD